MQQFDKGYYSLAHKYAWSHIGSSFFWFYIVISASDLMTAFISSRTLFWIWGWFCNVKDELINELRRRVCSCNKESLKFINELSIRIGKLFFFMYFFIDHSFDDVCALSFSCWTHQFRSPLLQYLCCFFSHHPDSVLQLSNHRSHTFFPSKLSKEYKQRS